ncbi:MAG: tetraacyldisaccharide 4'-kinase [Pirellulales bacterium]|nr:tetraacyldisaccharide 4'-kinase [Pirellulales bacterium]
MLDADAFRALVSGQRRGWTASALRAGLRLAEGPYRLAVAWRNRRYDRGRLPIERVGVPVVSVGNLTLGGTGKTPLVAWLARWLRTRGVRVSIVSRGYGAQHGGRNDEALELEQLLPDVPHLQNPDRAAAARVAVEELDTQLILLDDGFQHRRLARDLDIVLIDALAPFGYEHVFPRGMLREPAGSLRRADVVVLSRADAIDDAARDAIRRRAKTLAPGACWLTAAHVPDAWLCATGRAEPLAALAGRPLAAFCGLGNPRGFEHTLAAAGMQVASFRTFPDHHAYHRTDVEALAHWAEACGAEALVCTHKDLVKIGVDRLGRVPVWALTIRLELQGDLAALESQLTALAERAAAARPSDATA